MKLSLQLGSCCRCHRAWLPLLQQHRSFALAWRSSSSWRRSYSSSRSREDASHSTTETFHVTCGSSGSITVDLFNSHLLASPTAPLFIYLPPTGFHLREEPPTIPPFLLSPSTALARINYRWNHAPSTPRPTSTPNSNGPSPSPPLLTTHPSYANHPFPTPLHDTLHAYTFLTTSLLPSFTLPSKSNPPPSKSTFSPNSAYYSAPPSPRNNQRPLIIYGSYLGGTLAASLALTESVSSRQRPYTIAGLIVKNGIFDWTVVATDLPPESLSEDGKHGPFSLGQALAKGDDFHWDSGTLHGLKTRLFASPAGIFDAFASPTLFFRTSGLEVPSTWAGMESQTATSTESGDTASLMPSSPHSSLGPEPLSLDALSDSDFDSDNPIAPPSTAGPKITTLSSATQKAHLKFPPRDSGLKIPRTLLLTTSPPGPPPAPQSPASKRKTNPKSKAKAKLGSVTPAAQAHGLGTLMRRSVELHEFKERRQWDEGFDAGAAATERVEVYEFGHGHGAKAGEDGQVPAVAKEDKGGSGEEETVVKAWLEGSLS